MQERTRIIIPIGFVLLAILIFGGGKIYPSFFRRGLPAEVKGWFVDATYVPSAGGQGKVWLFTDGSFYYTKRIETGGSLSMSRESLFNKTYTYVYDPLAR